MIDRIFKINHTWTGFHLDLINKNILLQRNIYPIQLIDRIARSDLNNQISSANKVNQTESNTRYYKLPFLVSFSCQTQEKLDALIKKYCKSVSIAVIFTSFNTVHSFLNKDPVPSNLK